MSHRAESLAERIEEGAARLAAFVEGLSEDDWHTPVSAGGGPARQQTGVTKEAALGLLRRNSREAADAVRAFTDEELDRAAPFSLSFGAPVTAQFVIEDHALRHSWHHLAGIRAALGRGDPARA